MVDEPQSLVLELLRAIPGDLAEVKAELREHRQRLGAIERGFAHLQSEVYEARADFGTRLDRVADRLERLERRPGLLGV